MKKINKKFSFKKDIAIFCDNFMLSAITLRDGQKLKLN